jgi:hypothetical protein
MSSTPPAVPRCENGQLIYGEDLPGVGSEALLDIVACHEPGTETRMGRAASIKRFCPAHAASHDLLSGRLKLVTLRRWDELGDDFMTDCGHIRPVLTIHEHAALAAEQRTAA